MAFGLICSPPARFDLKDIAIFIAEDSPLAAERFAKKPVSGSGKITDYPKSGRVVPEFDDTTTRELIRKPCRIVHRIDRRKRAVELVAVESVRVWPPRGAPVIL